jgi:arylsulfatase A-like enzyme
MEDSARIPPSRGILLIPMRLPLAEVATTMISLVRDRYRRHPVLTVLPLTVTLLLTGGCRPKQEAADARASSEAFRPNVLLIITDTTRVDRLGCYGSDLSATPNLDALAESGTVFEHAYAPAPWTLPSVASLFTSLHPLVHGAGGRLGDFRPLTPNVETLAEVFQQAGYRTGAVLNVMFLSETFGMTRGFEHVDDFVGTTNTRMRPAADTTDAALAWLNADDDRPFFAVVHYFDPHLIYNPPGPFRKRFARQQDRGTDNVLFGSRREMTLFRQGKLHLPADLIGRLEALHNGEVAYTDQQIGRLLDRLADAGLRENTVIVLAADHGEEFLDHGGFEHGHTMYDELLHVPLIFAGAGVPTAWRVTDVVGLIDVAPTLCQLAGLPIPLGFGGQTLVPAIQGAPLPPRAVLSEGNMWGPTMYALRHERFKLIRDSRGQMLFDIAADPAERNDLLKANPAKAKQLATDLSLLLAKLELQRGEPSMTVELTAEELERMCALGYMACPE